MNSLVIIEESPHLLVFYDYFQTVRHKGINGKMIKAIFSISNEIRYVAIYNNGMLTTESKNNTQGASDSESDRYEELLVNPTLLKLATQRGNIDCGGVQYLLIRYGNFFQFICETNWGHVSVCIEKSADPIPIGEKVTDLIKRWEEKS